jgi:hypothetical protein
LAARTPSSTQSKRFTVLAASLRIEVVEKEKNMRELTHEDYAAAYEMCARMAVVEINSGGEPPPMLFMLAMHDKEPGTIVELGIFDPHAINAMQATAEGKDALLQLVRILLGEDGAKLKMKSGRAPDIAVHVSEAWGVTRNAENRHVMASQCPDRRDVLMTVVHAGGRSFANSLPVETVDGKRHVELAPFEQHLFIEGRLSLNPESPNVPQSELH